MYFFIFFFFFFQAEDGIRDVAVTGVQTCALRSPRARSAIKEFSIAGNTAASPSLPLPIRSSIQRSASSRARRRSGRIRRGLRNLKTSSSRRKKLRQVQKGSLRGKRKSLCSVPRG